MNPLLRGVCYGLLFEAWGAVVMVALWWWLLG